MSPRSADAALVSPEGENVVFLLGAPRSGTTWLAKIFDSHPDVIYRHEPDTVLRNDRLPSLSQRGDIAIYRDEAKAWLTRLFAVRTLKSAGSLPLFRKDYQGRAAHYLRAAMIYGLHAANALPLKVQWPRRIAIPDLIARKPRNRPALVMKSVSSRGRALLFAEAFPKSRIVFILRHPCGQVSSTLRGIKGAKFERTGAFTAALATDEARSLGLTEERFAALTPVEQCAWHWAVLNQKALNELAGLGESRVAIIRYEDACARPEAAAKELLAFAGLDWNEQTAVFVAQSTMAGDTDKYYGTSRNPLAAANRWRTTLSSEDQRRILDIAGRVPAGEMFRAIAAE